MQITASPIIIESLKSLFPPPKLKVSEWADLNRVLSREASAEAGKWDTGRTGYQRGIMDAVNEPGIFKVVFMKSSQVGATEIELNTIGYFIDQDPSPMLCVYPSEVMANAFSEDRLSTMLRDTPCLQGKVKDPRKRDSQNTKLHKMFPGGHISLVGSNSPSSLAMRPIRIVLLDEIDRYPKSSGGAEGEGDVVTLAIARTKTFFNKLIIMVGTPTIKGKSRIEMAYEESDMRKYWVPCPGCGEYQILEWKHVHWDKEGEGEKKKHKYKTASYVCPHCGVMWTDNQRAGAVKKGEWRAEKETVDTAGFFINELYSPWSRLSDIVKTFLEAKKTPETLQAFINTTLGETYEEGGDKIDTSSALGRAENYVKIPEQVAVQVASVDIQDDRVEVLRVGIGVDYEVWSLDHLVIQGTIDDKQVQNTLDLYLFDRYETEDGKFLKILCTVIDTGGHFTKEVYDYVKPREKRRVYAIKGVGDDGVSKPLVGRPSTSNMGGVKLFPVCADTGKDMLFARLSLEYDPVKESNPGVIHFNNNFDSEFFAQLGGEVRRTKYIRGFPRRIYVKTRRNEAIDLFVYCFAAYDILGIKNIKAYYDSIKKGIPMNKQRSIRSKGIHE